MMNEFICFAVAAIRVLSCVWGHAVAQLVEALRYKVASSIPEAVI
jgi:hypothetical protein